MKAESNDVVNTKLLSPVKKKAFQNPQLLESKNFITLDRLEENESSSDGS